MTHGFDRPSTQRALSVATRHGDALACTVHEPADEARGTVILCHGFKGFKDWGFFPVLAGAFAARGWNAVRFNFSLNGIGDDPCAFTRLDRFERNTVTRELEDLDDLVTALGEGPGSRPLLLFGHSRGGGVALLHASRDPRVAAVCTWAAVATMDRWGAETKRLWRERGVLAVRNARTMQDMPLGVALLDDVERNAARLDVAAAVSALRVPLLLVHGGLDRTVPPAEARALRDAAPGGRTALHIVASGDHTFGATHPFAGAGAAFAEALRRTLDWADGLGEDR